VLINRAPSDVVGDSVLSAATMVGRLPRCTGALRDRFNGCISSLSELAGWGVVRYYFHIFARGVLIMKRFLLQASSAVLAALTVVGCAPIDGEKPQPCEVRPDYVRQKVVGENCVPPTKVVPLAARPVPSVAGGSESNY